MQVTISRSCTRGNVKIFLRHVITSLLTLNKPMGNFKYLRSIKVENSRVSDWCWSRSQQAIDWTHQIKWFRRYFFLTVQDIFHEDIIHKVWLRVWTRDSLTNLVLASVHEKPETASIENLKNFKRSESVEKDRGRRVSISKILKTYLNSFAIEEENYFEIEIVGMKKFLIGSFWLGRSFRQSNGRISSRLPESRMFPSHQKRPWQKL